MYYTWNWWFLLSWIAPMMLFLWMLFGLSSTRRSLGYWRYYREPRDDWEQRGRLSDREGRNGRYRGLGPRNYRRSDARILEDVSDRLTMDPEIDASGMEVHVEGGKVTLTGAVASRSEKRLCDLVADSVAGVNDVDNRLRISTRAQSGSGAPEQALSR